MMRLRCRERMRSRLARLHEITEPLRKFGIDLAAGQLREMQRLELVGDQGRACVGRVDGHWKDEECAVRHVPYPIDGVAPLATEIRLEPALRRGGNDRDEVRAARDVPLDLAVVVVPDFQ